MNKRNKNLIYIYDTDHQKIIMIDGETGERVREDDDKVTGLLKYLHEQGRSRLLRKFAVWCTRQINEDLKPIQKKILDLAEKAIHEDVESEELNELYEETEGTAVAADTVGLRQGSRSAPAYLAARECINPDALEGAIQAARFHRLWKEMQDQPEEFSDKALKEIRAASDQDTLKNVTEQQTDRLLDLMNE
ncbi:hypothetical protein SAMN05443144_11256 [Fodinibius roseus]|uniref:Uncharacterized protein n=1 Tax=Fodinibius roseus TaxID=1194090 RepID=A0A1M5DWQ6_9BACT|nr:hypothetical protein [Fodinibius roseus]SHF71403.1 hypothetical protein SAMN05443144_11256 [Fodinibius roseus]